MSRQGRKISSTGIYHVMNKGVSNQIMFEDVTDCKYFLNLLKIYKKEYNIKIVAYCLMENHYHLLIIDKDCNISAFMQALQSRYAEFFNFHHKRCGPLHNGRFQSEVVENDEYLLTVLRYIIQNPQKAGISSYKDYKWSSYAEFFSNKNDCISDVSYIKMLFINQKEYISFIEKDSEDSCLEIKNKVFFGIMDEKAKKYIHKKFKVATCSALRSFERLKRNRAIYKLRKYGLSIRQIERLTGISRGIVQSIAA